MSVVSTSLNRKTIALIWMAVFLAFVEPIHALGDAERFQQLQVEGIKSLQARNYQKALQSFEAALKEHSGSWQTWQNLGNCHMQLGQYEPAIKDIQRSIELGGIKSAAQCTIMAAALEGLGQPIQALNWLKLACSVDPNQTANPVMQAAIRRLQDPEMNPADSPSAPDYFQGLLAARKWRKEDLPLRVFVRKNFQVPQFHADYVVIVNDSVDQWCKASGNFLTYKMVDKLESANVICDYTDHPELVAESHEPGLQGICKSRQRMDDGTTDWVNIVVLVKDRPNDKLFRDRNLIKTSFLHEAGHALGMRGHSSNPHDVMFLAGTPEPIIKLSKRDQSTMSLIYRQKNPMQRQ